MRVHLIRFDFGKSLEENATAIQSWYEGNPAFTIHFVVKYDDGLMIHYEE